MCVCIVWVARCVEACVVGRGDQVVWGGGNFGVFIEAATCECPNLSMGDGVTILYGGGNLGGSL